MTTSDPAGAHDWHSDAYVREWIGAYTTDERATALHGLVQLIPFDPDDAIRVLDIGGGWGPVSRAVLETFPNARMVLHDFSEAMLAEARGRLARYGDSVGYVRGDLMSSEWKAGLDGQFDAVVSSLAIHNVRFPDRIRAIYQEVFPLVAPGGCFVNLDRVATGELGMRAARHAQAMDRRQQLHEATGCWQPLSDVLAQSGAGRGPHAHGRPREEDLQRMAAHQPATLANQLRWLLEAGFDEADCFSREEGSTLIGAFRAGRAER